MLFYMDEVPARLHHMAEEQVLFPADPRALSGAAPRARPPRGGTWAWRTDGAELERALTAWQIMGDERREAFEVASARLRRRLSRAHGSRGELRAARRAGLPVRSGLARARCGLGAASVARSPRSWRAATTRCTTASSPPNLHPETQCKTSKCPSSSSAAAAAAWPRRRSSPTGRRTCSSSDIDTTSHAEGALHHPAHDGALPPARGGRRDLSAPPLEHFAHPLDHLARRRRPAGSKAVYDLDGFGGGALKEIYESDSPCARTLPAAAPRAAAAERPTQRAPERVRYGHELAESRRTSTVASAPSGSTARCGVHGERPLPHRGRRRQDDRPGRGRE